MDTLTEHTIGPEDLRFMEIPFLKPTTKNQKVYQQDKVAALSKVTTFGSNIGAIKMRKWI